MNEPRHFNSQMARKVRRLAADLAPSNVTRALDAACGTGLLFRETDIARGGLRLCLDQSAEFLNHCGDDCTKIVGDIFAPPLMPAPFDAIFLLNTLYNLRSVDEVARAFAAIEPLLAPDGVLITDIRNADSLLVRSRYGICRALGQFTPTAYRLSDVEQAAGQHGLIIRDTRRIGWPMPLAYVLAFSHR